MKIIIAGSGEVGRHLAIMLCGNKHDIIVIDENEERVKDLDANYDLISRVGNPTSISDLIDCEVKNSDLFIAVTPNESVNLTACILANRLGAKKTVARIDNNEYLEPQNREFFKQLGVGSLISPEILAAEEIVDSLKRGWIREFREFDDEKLVVICVKMRSNARILNKLFSTEYFNHDRYRIVAIKRKGETIIPKGSDEIKDGDLVYFICEKTNVEFVRKECGKEGYNIKNIMIMGGSRIAVKTLLKVQNKLSAKLIEQNKEKCYTLSQKLNNVLIINGDGHNTDLLKQEGIKDTDAFLAITSNSESNILAGLAAQRLGAKKIIAEVENLDYIDLVDNIGLGTMVNKKLIAASHIYEIILGQEATDVQHLTLSDAQIIEFVVRKGDKITKSAVKDLKLPKDINIGGIIRDGKGFIVKGLTEVKPGDHIIIFCKSSGINKISSFFS